jgi:hypothetical protein
MNWAPKVPANIRPQEGNIPGTGLRRNAWACVLWRRDRKLAHGPARTPGVASSARQSVDGMNGAVSNTVEPKAWHLYCPQCGRSMRVAGAHVNLCVACPHCEHTFEAWRRVQRSDGGDRSIRFDHPPQGVGGYSWRSRWVAGILGVLLGPLGVHRFYLGYIGIGLIQIIVTFVTVGFGGLWGFIEGVLCLTGPVMRDVDGLPLRA